MTEERVAPLIVRLIENNLGAIFASVFAAFSAFLIGTTTTDHRLDQTEKDNAELKAKVEKLEAEVDALDLDVVRLETTIAVQAESDRVLRKPAP